MSIYPKPLFSTKFNIDDFTYSETEALTLYDANKLYIKKNGNDTVKANLHFLGKVDLNNVNTLNELNSTDITYLNSVQSLFEANTLKNQIQDTSINILENTSVNYDLSINELIAKDILIDISLNDNRTYTDNAINSLIDSAPTTLDTLGEIGQIVTDNQGFITTMDNILTNVDTSLNTVFTDIDNIQTVNTEQNTRLDNIDTDIDNIETTLTNISYSADVTTIANDLKMDGTNGINITSSNASTSINIGKNSNSNTGSTGLGTGCNSYLPGVYATGIGFQCGATSSGPNSLSIGRNAGEYSCGLRTINIGSYANHSFASSYAISLGHNSGRYNAGEHVINIGRSNKMTPTTYGKNSTICINATGANINSILDSTCIIAPIRNDIAPISHKLLGYTSEKEVIQSDNFDISCNSINSISSTEISYLDGVTSNIQTQFINTTNYIDSENIAQDLRINNIDISLGDIINIDNAQNTRLDNIEGHMTDITYDIVTDTTIINNHVVCNNVNGERLYTNQETPIATNELTSKKYVDDVNITQNNRLDGIDTLNTTQNGRLDGIDTLNTTQNGRLDGIDTLNTTQNGRLDGIDTLNTTQNNRLSTLETQCTDISYDILTDTTTINNHVVCNNINGERLYTNQNTPIAINELTSKKYVDDINTTQNGRLDGIDTLNTTQNNRLSTLETQCTDISYDILTDTTTINNHVVCNNVNGERLYTNQQTPIVNNELTSKYYVDNVNTTQNGRLSTLEEQCTDITYDTGVTTIDNTVIINDKLYCHGLEGIVISGNNSAGDQTGVAIGNNTKNGHDTTGIGQYCHYSNAQNYATSIGSYCGTDYAGQTSVNIGRQCGRFFGGAKSTNIGSVSGYRFSGDYSVNIGDYSGTYHSGDHSINLGRSNKGTDGINAPDNTICINASGTNIDSTVANSCIISPIRDDKPTNHKLLGYNTTTKEVVINDAFDVKLNSVEVNTITSPDDGASSSLFCSATNVSRHINIGSSLTTGNLNLGSNACNVIIPGTIINNNINSVTVNGTMNFGTNLNTNGTININNGGDIHLKGTVITNEIHATSTTSTVNIATNLSSNGIVNMGNDFADINLYGSVNCSKNVKYKVYEVASNHINFHPHDATIFTFTGSIPLTNPVHTKTMEPMDNSIGVVIELIKIDSTDMFDIEGRYNGNQLVYFVLKGDLISSKQASITFSHADTYIRMICCHEANVWHIVEHY